MIEITIAGILILMHHHKSDITTGTLVRVLCSTVAFGVLCKDIMGLRISLCNVESASESESERVMRPGSKSEQAELEIMIRPGREEARENWLSRMFWVQFQSSKHVVLTSKVVQ